jgi:hypothetical protein
VSRAPFAGAEPGYRRDMTDEGVWRDEQRLPLSDLSQAMATSAQDGQVDDVTGNDAGAEQAFGHDAQVGGEAGDATDPDRATRPSTTGRTGPH